MNDIIAHKILVDIWVDIFRNEKDKTDYRDVYEEKLSKVKEDLSESEIRKLTNYASFESNIIHVDAEAISKGYSKLFKNPNINGFYEYVNFGAVVDTLGWKKALDYVDERTKRQPFFVYASSVPRY